MHDMSGQAVHHHAPPTGFIRKYIFSLDHKVIGEQYYTLALVAVYIGLVLSWIMRIHLAWPNYAIPGVRFLSKTGAPGGVLTPGVLPATDDHARHHHGLLCPDHRSLRGFRQLLPAHPGRRRGHAISAHQHDVVLGHVRRVHRGGIGLLRAAGTAVVRVDRLRPLERPGLRLPGRDKEPVRSCGRFRLPSSAWDSCSAR